MSASQNTSLHKRLYVFFLSLILGLGLHMTGCGGGGGGHYDPDADTDGNGVIECGDGVIEGYETCDDGNPKGSDGCSYGCHIEPSWICSGQPSICIPDPSLCGNGREDFSEECDPSTDYYDHNPSACTPHCKLAVCGDGYIYQVGGENCDDGNLNSGDGCNADCKIDPDYQCKGEPSVCGIPTACGDGNLDAGENCDDGNFLNTDDCTSYCKVALCGDGFAQDGIEECDDGNAIETDTCRNDCKKAACGDGVIETGVEECDDGNLNDNDNCPSTCNSAKCGDGFVQPSEECDDANKDNTDLCLNNCKNAQCGDGIRRSSGQNPEDCDDGNPINSDSCKNTCKSATCGDGIVWTATEVCDDGNQNNNDGCTNSCKPSRCGDGIIHNLANGGIEFCDDGNTNDNDGCRNNCMIGLCGDGILKSGESCDDGNLANGDGCTSGCQKESGYQCGGQPSVCMQPPASCGDGNVDLISGEQCDDGNTNANDACVNCKTAVCGDGYVKTGVEACDDGNIIDNDACRNNCTVPVCGDGILAAGVEQCDDGNNNPNDACVNCKKAFCGDGVIQTGFEICDDGNNSNFDTCLSGCRPAQCGDGFKTPGIGEECDDGNGMNIDACINCKNAKCGDGFVQSGIEECDDQNNNSNDTCVGCKIATCGDGVVQTGIEQCDDQNQIFGDGCSLNCLKEDEGFGQSIIFAKRFGGLNDPNGTTTQYNDSFLITDRENNVLFTGKFQYGIDFGNNVSLSSQNTSPFLVKFDSNGNPQWAKMMEETSTIYQSFIDSTNATLLVDASKHFSKFEENGDLTWRKTLIGYNNVNIPITLDSKDHIWVENLGIENKYLEGSYQRLSPNWDIDLAIEPKFSEYFDMGRILTVNSNEIYFLRSFGGTISAFFESFLSSGFEDLLITKIGEHGELLWQRSYGSVYIESLVAATAAQNGDLFVAVYAKVQTDVFGTPFSNPSTVVARLDATTGNPIWSIELPLANTPLFKPRQVTFEIQPNTGNLVFHLDHNLGNSLFMIDANSGTILAENKTLEGWKVFAVRSSGVWLYSSLGFVKLDSNLNLVWVRHIPIGLENPRVAIDSNGTPYVIGHFLGTLDLGNGQILQNPSAFDRDIAFIKLTP